MTKEEIVTSVYNMIYEQDTKNKKSCLFLAEEIADFIENQSQNKIETNTITKQEAYETMLNNMFSAMFNGNDFFAYACAWAVEVNDYDFPWMIEHVMKHGKDGMNACLAYIQNKEPIQPYLTDKFMEAIIELVERKQEVHGDGDCDQYYTDGGPYRTIKKED
jgi:hypothetical protein